MEQTNVILDALKNFVDQNKSNLQRVKVDNPALHDVVLDTLVFLNKKFGNQEVTKEEIVNEVGELQEPIVEKIIAAEENNIKEPEANVQSSQNLAFEIGDTFKLSLVTKEIPDLILRISDIVQDNISIDFYELTKPLTKNIPDLTEGYSKKSVEEKLTFNKWKRFDLSNIIQVGDIFKVVSDKNIPPNKQYKILVVDKAKDIIEYSLVDLDENTLSNGGATTIEFLKLIKQETLEKYVANVKPYKIGDKFKDYHDKNVPPKNIYTLVRIDFDNNMLTYDWESDYGKLHQQTVLSISRWDEFISDGNIVAYNPPKSISTSTPTATPQNTMYALGDLFIGKDVIVSSVDLPKRVFQIKRISSQNFEIENTYLEDGSAITVNIDKNTFFDDVESGTLKRYYPFKIGDKLINTLNGRDEVTINNIDGFTLYTTNIDENGIVSNEKYDIVVFLELMSNGVVEFENMSQSSSIPIPPYKVGNQFRDVGDLSNPPDYVYTLININKNWNTVTLRVFDRKSSTTQDENHTIGVFEDDLRKGDLVPYIASVQVTTPSPKPKQVKTPKPKTPKSAPAPIETNQSVVNLSCKEIKNAIKDLTLLVDLGDDTVLDEINELKQLLKTQNCK